MKTVTWPEDDKRKKLNAKMKMVTVIDSADDIYCHADKREQKTMTYALVGKLSKKRK